MNLNMEVLKVFIGYFLAINLIGFLSMGLDKHKAKKNAWRTPEKTLLGIALFLGGIGSLCGMYKFHHKTLHPQFKYGLPILCLINGVTIYFIFTKLILT